MNNRINKSVVKKLKKYDINKISTVILVILVIASFVGFVMLQEYSNTFSISAMVSNQKILDAGTLKKINDINTIKEVLILITSILTTSLLSILLLDKNANMVYNGSKGRSCFYEIIFRGRLGITFLE